jgi:catechol 2,3-dioxygenase-like lactoylglutathione lyase family enzyme
MADQNPSILNHVSLGTNDLDRAVAFYDAALAPLGVRQLMAFPGGVVYGRAFPEFFVQTPIDGAPATVGNGTHIGFNAASEAEVDAFYAAALAAGARDDGAPGGRPHYSAAYYGCFVRDLDGHKIEATFWDESKDTEGHGG